MDSKLVTFYVFKNGAWKCEIDWKAAAFKIFVRKFSGE